MPISKKGLYKRHLETGRNLYIYLLLTFTMGKISYFSFCKIASWDNWICLQWNPDKQSIKNQPGLELQIYIESENVILQWFNVYGAFVVFSCMFLVAQSCLALSDPMDCSQPGSSIHGDSPGKNTEVGCYVLLQGIFPTQGLNPGLHICRQILYCLRHREA